MLRMKARTMTRYKIKQQIGVFMVAFLSNMILFMTIKYVRFFDAFHQTLLTTVLVVAGGGTHTRRR